MNQPFTTFSEIVNEPERSELHDYALKLKVDKTLRPNPISPNRYFRCIWDSPLVTPLIRQVADRIEQRFGLHGIPVDPELGWVISVIYQGGYVHPHTDARMYRGTQVKHLRCNVVISKPEGGGIPIVGKQPVPLIERGGWAFFASQVEHSASAVDSARPRIVYQFGYSVPLDWQFPSISGLTSAVRI